MKSTAATKATESRKTTLDLDADNIARLRAMLRATGGKLTAEQFLDDLIGDLLKHDRKAHLPETALGVEEWASHPRKAQIAGKLDRCFAGDRRLVRTEPLPRNTRILGEAFPRLLKFAADHGTTHNVLASRLVEHGLDRIDSGAITFGPTQPDGGEA